MILYNKDIVMIRVLVLETSMHFILCEQLGSLFS